MLISRTVRFGILETYLGFKFLYEKSGTDLSLDLEKTPRLA